MTAPTARPRASMVAVAVAGGFEFQMAVWGYHVDGSDVANDVALVAEWPDWGGAEGWWDADQAKLDRWRITRDGVDSAVPAWWMLACAPELAMDEHRRRFVS